ncbi:CLUMA_CG013148, isoform A [Clunio marinus]|uniref:CLUMA_CG013148, isoform A n=1 Tax=Clunio marinus TaxID=568069 RepID=A0A1J1IHW8_9DIPT|nr:CLUMA_CG013148, isoform A [Clunio marinus]
MKLNLYNLNHCDWLTSVHSAIQSQHQNQVGASPKDNKKNYLKFKMSTKRLQFCEICWNTLCPVYEYTSKLLQDDEALH